MLTAFSYDQLYYIINRVVCEMWKCSACLKYNVTMQTTTEFASNLKKLRNCNWKLFLSATEMDENTVNFLNWCFSESTHTLAHQTKYLQIKTKFTSYQWYLFATLL